MKFRGGSGRRGLACRRVASTPVALAGWRCSRRATSETARSPRPLAVNSSRTATDSRQARVKSARRVAAYTVAMSPGMIRCSTRTASWQGINRSISIGSPPGGPPIVDRGATRIEGACSILDRHRNLLGSWDQRYDADTCSPSAVPRRPWTEKAHLRRHAAWDHAGFRCAAGRRATTSPAFQPGARPPSGGWIESGFKPLLAIGHEIAELAFHISPVPNSSRPQTGVGREGTKSSNRRAHSGSSVSRRGLSTASPRSGMTPSRQRRTA